MSKTVYRVEGKTGWFAVSVNGKQNSGLFHFIRNPAYHFYKSVLFTAKRPRKPQTGIKDSFGEMEHEYPSGTFLPEKQE